MEAYILLDGAIAGPGAHRLHLDGLRKDPAEPIPSKNGLRYSSMDSLDKQLDLPLLQAKWVLGGMEPKELVQLAVSALHAISLRHKRKPTSANKTGRFMTRNELRLMRSQALCLIFCSSL